MANEDKKDFKRTFSKLRRVSFFFYMHEGAARGIEHRNAKYTLKSAIYAGRG